MIKAGDNIPDVEVVELQNEQPVFLPLKDAFPAGKKGIFFGVPGAFTPGCHKVHLPGYVQDFDKLKAAGADFVVCITVNDPFVSAAWGESMDAVGKVRILSDPTAKACKALGLEWDDMAHVLGGPRCSRFSAIVEDGKIKTFNPEKGGGLTCSLANVILEQLKQ